MGKQVNKKITGSSVGISATLHVVFDDIEKARQFYINGVFSKVFWEIHDDDDMIRNIALAIHNTDEAFEINKETGEGERVKSPEGFGRWVKIPCTDKYIHESEETGKILVVYDQDLDADSVFELSDSELPKSLESDDLQPE